MKSGWMMFFSLLAALVLYTVRQAARLMPGRPLLAWVAALALFVLMFSGHFLARAGAARLESRAIRLLTWVGFMALGIWATFLVFWLPLDLLSGMTFLVRSLLSPGRTGFVQAFRLSGWIPAGFFVLSAGQIGRATCRERV